MVAILHLFSTAGFYCHAISSVRFFIPVLFEETFHPNLQSFVRRRHVGVPRRGCYFVGGQTISP